MAKRFGRWQTNCCGITGRLNGALSQTSCWSPNRTAAWRRLRRFILISRRNMSWAEGHSVLVVPISTEQDARALSGGVIHAGRLHNVACPYRTAPPAQVELASPADRVAVLSESLGRYSHPHSRENAKCVPCYDAWPQKARPHQCGWDYRSSTMSPGEQTVAASFHRHVRRPEGR